MSYPIAAIGTDADEAKRLKALRIRTAERLLEAAKNPKGRKELAAKTGIDPRSACSASPTPPTACGSRASARSTPRSCRPSASIPSRNSSIAIPEKLAKAISELNKKRKLVRFLPTVSLVTRWIEHAKKLPMKITYR